MSDLFDKIKEEGEKLYNSVVTEENKEKAEKLFNSVT